MVNFKSLLDKATGAELSEPDWETILEIVEEIKTRNVTVKSAVKELRRKLLDSEPMVVYHTLCVLDSVMKNCASEVHSEVLSAEFMNVMKGVVTSKDGKSEKAIDKALELIGEWKSAFGQQPGYKAVYDTFSELQKEGFHIPETQVASAAFIKKAPEWMMGERCCLCRQEFSRIKGYFRHHCRNCGKSVCTQCSGKRAALPHFGIEEKTRVCDVCYKNMDKPSSKDSDTSSDLPAEYLRSSLAQESQLPPGASTSSSSKDQEQEEDDLQMAIAMSLNEQENKKVTSSSQPRPRVSPSPNPPQTSAPSAPPPAPPTLYATIAHDTPSTTTTSSTSHYQSNGVVEEPEPDPTLARYLDRSYWEQRKQQQQAEVQPQVQGMGVANAGGVANDMGPQPVALGQTTTTTPLADTIRKTLDMFVQRMQEVGVAGGSVAADPVVLSMYQNLTAMQPQLLKQIDDVQQKKAHQEQILQKLNEAKEARASLNSMRRKHLERIKQQEEEQALLARMQMEQKLALLRQQKAEQLSYQESLQQRRLEAMQTQHSEYEKQLQAQREKERQQLIVQEQQVLQHQFGPASSIQQHQQYPSPAPPLQQQYGTSPTQHTTYLQQNPLPQQLPPAPAPSLNPAALPMHSLLLHDPTQQAPPLPTKLDHNPIADPTPPPPYQPPLQQQQAGMLYQPQSMQPVQLQPPSQSQSLQPAQFQPTGQPQSMQPAQFHTGQPQSIQPAQFHTGQPQSMQQPQFQATSQPQSMQPAQFQPTSQPMSLQGSYLDQPPPSMASQPLTMNQPVGQQPFHQPPSTQPTAAPQQWASHQPPQQIAGQPPPQQYPSYQQAPPTMQQGPPTMQQAPPTMQQGPPTMQQAPPSMQQAPPTMQPPLQPTPAQPMARQESQPPLISFD